MKQFISFVKKEFIHILRDPRSLLILLLMPLIMVMLLGYVIKNDVRDIRVAVLDPSRDIYTTKITERIAANDYFVYKGEVKTEAEAEELFRKGDIDLVLIYCSRFADRLIHSQDAAVQILSDGSEPNQASVRVAYAQAVIGSVQRELAMQGQQANKSQQAGGGMGSIDIKVNSRMLFNPQQRSEANFVPGVVGMITLLICCMMTSIAIVREKEMSTMEILLASPLPAINIVLAKLMPYVVISLFNIVSILCITNFVMDVPMEGSVAAYMFVALIYIFVALMLGLLISTCVNTQLAAMLLSLLIIVPTIYLSGMMFPLESMPTVAQVLSNIVPARWFITASRKIMIEGVEIQFVAREIVALIIQGSVLLLLSWKCFKTRLE